MNTIDDARAEALITIRLAVDDAAGILESHNATAMSHPGTHTGAEWDWFADLSRAEKSRLRRNWFTDRADPPDVIADHFALPIDEAMAEWLRCTRIVDAGDVVVIGLRNSHRAHHYESIKRFGGLDLNDLLSTGYDLTRLLCPRPICTDYLAELTAAEDDMWKEVESCQSSPSFSTPLPVF